MTKHIENLLCAMHHCGLPRWLSGNESACNAVDLGLIPGSGRSPGGGHGNPLQYSCLGNPMDTGAWRITVHGVTKSQRERERQSMHAGITVSFSM